MAGSHTRIRDIAAIALAAIPFVLAAIAFVNRRDVRWAAMAAVGGVVSLVFARLGRSAGAARWTTSRRVLATCVAVTVTSGVVAYALGARAAAGIFMVAAVLSGFFAAAVACATDSATSASGESSGTPNLT